MPQISVNTDMSEELCFGCGRNNPIGLKLSFQWDGSTVRAEFTPGEQYQGWLGVIHGGIIATILDEAMAYAAHFTKRNCVTAEMAVKFRRLAPVGEPLAISASIVRNTRKIIRTESQIRLRDGTLVAEGTATQFVVEDRASGGKEIGERRGDG